MGNSLQQLIILLPCYSLEDLSLDRDGREAAEILSGWSALFHPVLLARAGTVPKWDRADVPPAAAADSLIVIPECSFSALPDGWLEEARAAGAIILRGLGTRREVVAAALAELGEPAPPVDEQLAADFFALGFCHLQVELLTRQLRYMSNLDEVQFQRKASAAAEKALEGDAEGARQQLRGAFDLLTEAREYFYPVETHLLDLTLVAPTTIGESLRAELASPGPINLLVSGQTVQQMALREPATLAALKEALEKGTASIVGGEFEEHELAMLEPQAVLAQLERGLNSYDRYLDERPKTFGRRRYGLSPRLPQVLRGLGFEAALHFTLDDGSFPTGKQSKIRWQGIDASTIAALGRLPLDASRPECFLRLPERLGNLMDLDHTATMVFAHWPGGASPWYRDLRRMSDHAPVLGRFLLMSSYFRTTEHSGQTVRHKVDQYRSPYLRQCVAAGKPDPISRWVRYFRRRAAAEAEAALQVLADMAGGRRLPAPPEENLLLAVEDARSSDSDAQRGLDDRIARRLDTTLARLASVLPRQDRPTEQGRLLVNPASFPRRYCTDVSDLSPPPDVQAPVQRVAEWKKRTHAVVEVPPMGFAWVGAGSAIAAVPDQPPETRKTKSWWGKRPPAPPPMAEEDRLRNEFFEVAFNPTTGAIQAIHDYSSRGNRIAQQIAFRFPRDKRSRLAQEDPEMAYSVMAADRLSVVSAGPLVAEMESRGRLLDRDGKRLARFVQTTRVERGSRLIEIAIDLDVDQQPGPHPWDSYYAARFAWGDATADLYRSVGTALQPTDAAELEAPDLVEIRTEKGQTAILAGGLPYHRHLGLRKLDTLLIVRGETARSFRLGVGIDLPQPVTAAMDLLAPRPVLVEKAPPPLPDHAWLFHVDSRNVVAAGWATISSGGRVAGFRARLLETEGRRGKVNLRTFRRLASARKTDLAGGNPEELSIDGDRITMDVGAHGWLQIEARFADTSAG